MARCLKTTCPLTFDWTKEMEIRICHKLEGVTGENVCRSSEGRASYLWGKVNCTKCLEYKTLTPEKRFDIGRALDREKNGTKKTKV